MADSIRNDNPNIKSYTAQLADGRLVTIDATDEETARRLAREQGGGLGVLSVEVNDNPDATEDDTIRGEFVDVTPAEGNAGGNTAPVPNSEPVTFDPASSAEETGDEAGGTSALDEA